VHASPPASSLSPYTTLFRSAALKRSGAAEGTRTPDPIITNDVLYQLSYCGAEGPVAGSDGRSFTGRFRPAQGARADRPAGEPPRSEEHTSELQSREKLVCRL